MLKKTRKQRSPRKVKRFLTIDTEVQAWDQDEKEQRISDNMTHVRKMVEEMVKQTAAMTETTDLYKSRSRTNPSYPLLYFPESIADFLDNEI